MNATKAQSPIFVRGLSRSGGTLLVTVLDAHPDVAMSYELYPNLLEWEGGSREGLAGLASKLRKETNEKRARKVLPVKELNVFMGRCLRSGIDHQGFADLLLHHVEGGDDFLTLEGRMRLIERCATAKMASEGKSRWGLKCTNRFDEYLTVWPDAHFLNMLRDGRDVLASQLNTGSFKNSPSDVAHSWSRTHRRFRSLLTRSDVHAYEVRYERLVAEPEDEVRRIAAFLDLQYADSMLDFYKKDLTVYTTAHLSMDRISKPVDTTRVGRWRRELSQSQLAEFSAEVGEFLMELGYSE